MNPLALLGRWWRKWERGLDRRILWPSFRDLAKDERHEMEGKLIHVCIDSAWVYPEEWKGEEPSLYEYMIERAKEIGL